LAYLQQSRLCSSWPLQLQAVSENVKGFAGTLTQNDMQVVRMWIGGADFQHLDALQPMQPGQYLPRALLPMPHFIAASPYPCASWAALAPSCQFLLLHMSSLDIACFQIVSYASDMCSCFFASPSEIEPCILFAMLRAVFNLLTVKVWAALLLLHSSTMFRTACCH
jgi:magnesium-transporting ATPase (P-type)